MKITIYTITDCPFSKAEKEFLASKNLQFEEKNLETNRDFLTEMLTISNNFAGVPVTHIVKDDGTETTLKGFTKEDFEKELSAMLAGSTQSATSAGSDKSATSVTPANMGSMDLSQAPNGVPSGSAQSAMSAASAGSAMPEGSGTSTQSGKSEMPASTDLSNVMNTLSSMSSSTPMASGQQPQMNLASADSAMSIPDLPGDSAGSTMPALSDTSAQSNTSDNPAMAADTTTPTMPAPDMSVAPATPVTSDQLSADSQQPMTPTAPATQAPQVPDFQQS